MQHVARETDDCMVVCGLGRFGHAPLALAVSTALYMGLLAVRLIPRGRNAGLAECLVAVDVFHGRRTVGFLFCRAIGVTFDFLAARPEAVAIAVVVDDAGGTGGAVGMHRAIPQAAVAAFELEQAALRWTGVARSKQTIVIGVTLGPDTEPVRLDAVVVAARSTHQYGASEQRYNAQHDEITFVPGPRYCRTAERLIASATRCNGIDLR